MVLWIGWLGMSLIVIGTYIPSDYSRLFFLLGTVTLGVTALLGRSRFYTALQAPIIIGAGIPFVPGGFQTPAAGIMFIVAIGAAMYLAYKQELAGWQSKVGALGLLLLAGGFASGEKLWLLPANATLLFNAAYRFCCKGEKVAIVWLILEILASAGTVYSLITT